MASIVCVEGDTQVRAQFFLTAGAVFTTSTSARFSLADATSVTFMMNGLTSACTLIQPGNGLAFLILPSTMTATAGEFQATIKVTTAAGDQFFPGEDPIAVTVLPHTRTRP